MTGAGETLSGATPAHEVTNRLLLLSTLPVGSSRVAKWLLDGLPSHAAVSGGTRGPRTHLLLPSMPLAPLTVRQAVAGSASMKDAEWMNFILQVASSKAAERRARQMHELLVSEHAARDKGLTTHGPYGLKGQHAALEFAACNWTGVFAPGPGGRAHMCSCCNHVTKRVPSAHGNVQLLVVHHFGQVFAEVVGDDPAGWQLGIDLLEDGGAGSLQSMDELASIVRATMNGRPDFPTEHVPGRQPSWARPVGVTFQGQPVMGPQQSSSTLKELFESQNNDH